MCVCVVVPCVVWGGMAVHVRVDMSVSKCVCARGLPVM